MSPVILDEPAGGVPNSLVFSVDISRDIYRKDEAAADIIAINSYGEFINPSGRLTSRGEILSVDTVKERILEIFLELRNSGFIKIEPENLVYIHDGDSRSEHAANFIEGFKLAVNDLIDNKLLATNLNLIILDVAKNVNFRIFNINQTNPEDGTYVMKDNEIYLVASQPKETIGSAKPLRLKIKYMDNSIYDEHNLVKLVNDLRYLDFVSPYKKPRLPIVQHLAHKKSNIMRIEPSIGYLP